MGRSGLGSATLGVFWAVVPDLYILVSPYQCNSTESWFRHMAVALFSTGKLLWALCSIFYDKQIHEAKETYRYSMFPTCLSAFGLPCTLILTFADKIKELLLSGSKVYQQD